MINIEKIRIPDLSVEFEDSVGIICIDRPNSLNALNHSVFSQLSFLLNEIVHHKEIKCLVITGSGPKAFVAGADIAELSAIPIGNAKYFLDQGNGVMHKIESFHIPVIAAINGFALGGGCELALACHIRWASEKAKFGLPEINLGIMPGYGGTQRLPRIIGKGRALEMMLTGEMIDAEKALQFGLINKIVPEIELLNVVKEFAKKLVEKAPIAIKNIICATNTDLDLHAGIKYEGELFTECADTTDFKEGTAAFFSKRKAIFTGK